MKKIKFILKNIGQYLMFNLMNGITPYGKWKLIKYIQSIQALEDSDIKSYRLYSIFVMQKITDILKFDGRININTILDIEDSYMYLITEGLKEYEAKMLKNFKKETGKI